MTRPCPIRLPPGSAYVPATRAFSSRCTPPPGERLPDRPVAAVFRCADPGVATEIIFGQSWGSLLTTSTWGHVIDTGVLATLEYAVETLEVPLVIVLGHHNCQAMHAAKRAWDHAALPNGATRNAVEHAMWSIVRRGIAADSVEPLTSAHIIETGLALMQRSPAIAQRVDHHKCAIICATTNPIDGQIQAHATFGAAGENEDTLVERV
jgi:carbonic anhydrase